MTGTRSFLAEELGRFLIRVCVCLFLISPFLIWIAKVPAWDWLTIRSSAWPMATSLWQAALSTTATMLVGFVLFRALQCWPNPRSYRFIEAILLLPNLVPPLFIALALLSWSAVFGQFPFGMGAVVVAHVLLNAGLVAISIDRLFKMKMGGASEAAWVMGVKPMRFWWRVAWPILRGDVASLSLFVFAIGFTSFSLPLLLSGERIVTLEIAIFDTIRGEGKWDHAVMLAALQTLLLFALAYLLPRPLWTRAVSRFAIPYLGLPLLKHFVWIPFLVLLAGWGVGTLKGLGSGIEGELFVPIVEGIVTSLAIGLAVGLLHLFLFLLVAYVSPHDRLNKFLSGYLSPSPTIIGFGLLLLPVSSEWGRLGLLTVALTMISFPLLYRWLVHSALAALRRQVGVARSLGANWLIILRDVVWPQSAHALLRASGLAALWASGDFALSGILLGDEVTLPVLMNALLSQYRYDTAQLLLFPLLVVGLGLYVLFAGVARYVAR